MDSCHDLWASKIIITKLGLRAKVINRKNYNNEGEHAIASAYDHHFFVLIFDNEE